MSTVVRPEVVCACAPCMTHDPMCARRPVRAVGRGYDVRTYSLYTRLRARPVGRGPVCPETAHRRPPCRRRRGADDFVGDISLAACSLLVVVCGAFCGRFAICAWIDFFVQVSFILRRFPRIPRLSRVYVVDLPGRRTSGHQHGSHQRLAGPGLRGISAIARRASRMLRRRITGLTLLIYLPSTPRPRSAMRGGGLCVGWPLRLGMYDVSRAA